MGRKAIPLALMLLLFATAHASYVNFEVSHVHPIDLTPSGDRLLVVNTPDARLEVFAVQSDGSLVPETSIPVGLEPVTVVARTDDEAWVVNNLSDSVSVVDLNLGVVVKTIRVGDEPTDVAFAAGRAFVSVSSEDMVKVYSQTDPGQPLAEIPLFSRDVRALAVSPNGQKVYAVTLRSGNQTAIVKSSSIHQNQSGLFAASQASLGLADIGCWPPSHPPYPPLPEGIYRNTELMDPPPPQGVPEVALLVSWNEAAGEWQDEAGQDWTHCVRFRLPDEDLFVIDATSMTVEAAVANLGTSLFEVSVNPANGRIYVPHTDAKNDVRFEHPLGLEGYFVENRFAVVDPANSNSVTQIYLNNHIDRESNPATNQAERNASIAQPGMMVWNNDGTTGYATGLGSRKVFRVNGECLTGSCIFGPDRATPQAVEVGDGPSGLALRQAGNPENERLYVLKRVDHSIAIVKTSTLEVLDEIPLHDPSSEQTRVGRRFLYDAVDLSGHGDSSCSTCHLSADMDGLAWDLGNPESDLVHYDTPYDNVRFVNISGSSTISCFPGFCAGHDGFDPQKGPMVTPTLRGLLEPLHWRGDRATMNDFNQTFVTLQGADNVGQPGELPAGLPSEDMEAFRQFALEIAFPPNPFRLIDDTTPCGSRHDDPECEVLVHGALVAGNPTEGGLRFHDDPTWYSDSLACAGCHMQPFGTQGGQLGGVTPQEPTSLNVPALIFSGYFDSNHNDLKISHMRNMYEKFGPLWPAPTPGSTPPDTKVAFGYSHNGSFPDMYRFLSDLIFIPLNGQGTRIKDLVTFMFYYPTGTKPAVGRQVTFPPGLPPTGTPEEEALLMALLPLGDLQDPFRHCELVASTFKDGQVRTYHFSSGLWVSDIPGEEGLSSHRLRQTSQQPVTFTCATLESGLRLGGDRDEDARLNGDDCAPADAGSWLPPEGVSGLALDQIIVIPQVDLLTRLVWDDQAAEIGPGVHYDVLTGDLSSLALAGFDATSCLETVAGAEFTDPRLDPVAGDGYYYLVRAVNSCGTGEAGEQRRELDTLVCADP